jgi:hypothetical protein
MSADAPPPSRGHDRVPPHSLDAEVSVLGACLISRNAVTEAGQFLKPDDFYRNAHRVVFEAIMAVDRAGEAVDTITVTEWLARHGRLGIVAAVARAARRLAEHLAGRRQAVFTTAVPLSGADQQRLEAGVLAGEPEDQVGAGLDSLLEAVLFHLPKGGELLVDEGAHAHQPQPIPLGMAGPGQLLEVSEQAVLELPLAIPHGLHGSWVPAGA